MSNKVRMGMVGGGPGAFIGAVHRMAANLDGQVELVCGAFAGSAQRSQVTGHELMLADDRIYPDFTTMMKCEAALPKDQRMEFVSIVTPNHMHLPVAREALTAGFHVLSDKPATLNVAEVMELQALVKTTGKLYGLTHVYTGYPMIKEARQRIASGQLGNIRKVVVEYLQGWLSADQDNKQASWRADPNQSGISGCMGDIGSHAANLAEYVSGKRITQVCADLNTFVAGRRLDDDGVVLLQMEGGARGLLQASQIAAGEENNLTLRIYGEKGGLEWRQQEPNSLWLKWLEQPQQLLRTGGNHSSMAAANTRLPMGHPEGYLEAFANVYGNFSTAVRCHARGEPADGVSCDYPDISDAVRGMNLVEAFVRSSQQETRWHRL